MAGAALLGVFSRDWSDRAYEGELPWNLHNWEHVLWMCRMGRLSVAAALYALGCAAMGLRRGSFAAALVFAASVMAAATSVLFNWRCFAVPGAYWPVFRVW
jgi:hypothetical protein